MRGPGGDFGADVGDKKKGVAPPVSPTPLEAAIGGAALCAAAPPMCCG